MTNRFTLSLLFVTFLCFPVFSSEKAVQLAKTERKRDFTPNQNYFLLPVSKNAPTTWIRVEVDGKLEQEFFVNLTESGEPDFYANLSSVFWKGKKVAVIAEEIRPTSQGLDLIKESDEMADNGNTYKEKFRPQFHFSPRFGWTNDPNGLVYYNGIWHLFYQHNPFGTEWGNMTWGHATSPDLFHWTEHADAINPDKFGVIYSGSGVVDHKNTSGFQSGDDKPIVLAYTYWGDLARPKTKNTQGIAYSSDGGKTFKKYDKNPVVPNITFDNRDPKIIWHEPTKKWIMALYLEHEDYALFGSPNLKDWEKLCDIKRLGCSECPDFFELPVDGDAKNTKWVFWGANGKYVLGSFDGTKFKPESEPLTAKFGGNDYAAMTFDNAPDGRRIQLSWMQGGRYPDMPFNQQFSIPREFSLRNTENGVRLFMYPVKELESLRGELTEAKSGTFILVKSDQFDAEITLNVADSTNAELKFFGTQIVYKPKEKRIWLGDVSSPLSVADGKLKLRIVVDRTSIEMFAQNGEVQIAKCYLPNADFVKSGIAIKDAELTDAKIWEIKSVWP